MQRAMKQSEQSSVGWHMTNNRGAVLTSFIKISTVTIQV